MRICIKNSSFDKKTGISTLKCTIFLPLFCHINSSQNSEIMKNTNYNRTYGNQKQKTSIDESLVLGGLTFFIFVYIAFRFVYPMVANGLLF